MRACGWVGEEEQVHGGRTRHERKKHHGCDRTEVSTLLHVECMMGTALLRHVRASHCSFMHFARPLPHDGDIGHGKKHSWRVRACLRACAKKQIRQPRQTTTTLFFVFF